MAPDNSRFPERKLRLAVLKCSGILRTHSATLGCDQLTS